MKISIYYFVTKEKPSALVAIELARARRFLQCTYILHEIFVSQIYAKRNIKREFKSMQNDECTKI